MCRAIEFAVVVLALVVAMWALLTGNVLQFAIVCVSLGFSVHSLIRESAEPPELI